MRKLILVVLGLLGIGVLITLTFFIIGLFKPKIAGIYIETNPPATVYINGDQVGRTPYRDKRNAGEIVVRLIPESFQTPLAPYDTKITLVPGVETVIKRDFGDSLRASSGEIISFEKIDKNQVGLVIVSTKDPVQVLIDGKDRAFTPHKTSSISPGIHKLTLSAEGFSERTLEVKTHTGYKLTAVVQLAEVETKTEDVLKSEPEVMEKEKPMVEILSTPVGFLRVRKEPSTLADEVGRVEPGEKYILLAEDEKTGWFKIEFEEGKEGWITNQYAKKLETSSTLPSASPSATPKVSPTKTPTPKPSATPTS